MFEILILLIVIGAVTWVMKADSSLAEAEDAKIELELRKIMVRAVRDDLDFVSSKKDYEGLSYEEQHRLYKARHPGGRDVL